MSDDRTPLISQENLPTYVAVSFILGLIGIVLGLFGTLRSYTLAASLLMSHSNSLKTQDLAKANEAKIAALEQKIAKLEAGAATPAAPTEPAASAEPAQK